MCGIAAYIGNKEGLLVVLNNLRKLEYRGYDSAGVVYFQAEQKNKELKNIKTKVVKSIGKLNNLVQALKNETALKETAVLGHTRWATHGAPTVINAHPHFDCQKEIFLVHNGIIENHLELKNQLRKKGHRFRSQTDTEVIAHLIEEYGFEKTLKKMVGAYALAVIKKSEPRKIYLARLGSPLVIGIGEDGYYLASDSTALADSVKKIIYLQDGQQGVLSLGNFKIGPVKPKIEMLKIKSSQIKKGGFPYFMLKEIFEGPGVIKTAWQNRLFTDKQSIKLNELKKIAAKLKKIKRLEIVACGTSYYAGMMGEIFFEELAGLPVKTILSSEYRYRQHPVHQKTASIFISQSGETADTLGALKKARQEKHPTISIVNVIGSSIARETDAVIYNNAGPEIGVASTKAFLSQLTILLLMALYFSKNKKTNKEIIKELMIIPEKINSIFKQTEKIKTLALKYSKYNNFLYLGRKYNYPTALEGALKLKEISYIHAEGYAAGEMKHGPIALIDAQFPIIALATKNNLYKKIISSMEEIKARGGPILAIATANDKTIAQIADDVFYVPQTLEPLEPFLNIAPLQLFAYYISVLKGRDVDKPRNLAKSVTVE